MARLALGSLVAQTVQVYHVPLALWALLAFQQAVTTWVYCLAEEEESVGKGLSLLASHMLLEEQGLGLEAKALEAVGETLCHLQAF